MHNKNARLEEICVARDVKIFKRKKRGGEREIVSVCVCVCVSVCEREREIERESWFSFQEQIIVHSFENKKIHKTFYRVL